MDMHQVWGNSFNEWRTSYEERRRREEEQARTKQRQIMELPPLPRRAAPHPWEDLASVLSRTARVMGYEQPQWLLRPEAAGHRIDLDSLPALHRPIDSLLLCRLLHLEEQQLHSLTLHRFAPRFARPLQTVLAGPAEPNERPPGGRFFLEERDRSFFLASRYTQVCPRCLDEDKGYDRLYWRCNLLLHCPRHRVFLVRHCPTCHARIPALRPLSTTCPSCGQGDYRSAVLSPQVEEEPWLQASHALLLGHLGVEPIEAGTGAKSDGSTPLRLLDPWDFFWLLKEFTRIFDLDAHQEKVLPLLIRTFSLQELVARASACRSTSRGASSWVILHYLLAGWPAHFLAFLSCIPRVMQEENHYPAQGALVFNWGSAMVQGNYWCRRAYEADTIPRMRLFFGMYTECFEQLPPFEVVKQRQSKPLVLSQHLNPVTTENAGEPNPKI